MTTPRDDIAGLSERLREVERAELDVASQADCRPEDTANYVYAGTCREAATQLDSLQARVRELEGELTNCRSDCAATSNSYLQRAIDAESRAARLQQERDEAYERAAKVAETLGVYQELNVFAGGPEWCRHGKAIAAAIRRLAGPEKEGK